MTGLRHALRVLDSSIIARLLVVCFLPVALAGCAALRAYQEEAREAVAEAQNEERLIAATDVESALLRVARVRDARGDSAELARWTRHPSSAVRLEALRALGLVGELAYVPVLAGALSDPDASVRSMAAFALSQHWAWAQTDLERVTTGVEIESWLLEALADPFGFPGDVQPEAVAQDPVFARALLRALGEFSSEEGAEALFAAAQHKSLRTVAHLSLAIRGKNKHLPPLSSVRLKLLANEVEQGSAAWTLAYLLSRVGVGEAPEAQEAAADLLDRLRHAEAPVDEVATDVRAWALRAMGHLDPDRAVEPLVDSLRPEVPFRLRLSAVRAAGVLGIPGIPILKQALNDRDERIRFESASALGAKPTGEGYRALVAGWAADGPGSRACVAPGLEARLVGLAGHPPSWPPDDPRLRVLLEAAEGAMDCENALLRSAAVGLLASLPGAAAAQRLQVATEAEQDRLVVLALAQGMASRPDPILEGNLLRWLRGGDPILGAIAAEGLGKREGAHITASLLTAFEENPGEGDWERRLAIVEALVARGQLNKESIELLAADSSPHVRRAVYEASLAARRHQVVGSRPEAWTVPEPADCLWGVGDVRRATVRTDKGLIAIALYPHVAPATVASFVQLAEQGTFDGLLFHRVVPDFVIQGGDPEGTGWGGPGYTLRDEFSPVPYQRGTVGMARSGLNTAGSQWFVTHSPQPHLDGHYTVFGQVEEGMEVVDAMRRGDTIVSVQIHRSSP